MAYGLWLMAYGLTIWFPGSSGITGKFGGERKAREERGRKNGKREGDFSRISRTTSESKHIGLWLMANGLWLNDLVFWKFWIDWRLREERGRKIKRREGGKSRGEREQNQEERGSKKSGERERKRGVRERKRGVREEDQEE
ncbi:MAG: hypothetical protein IKZ84_01115 [Victivallales bacterium]|nr:hypothetical protein [Victivallales bacterium]